MRAMTLTLILALAHRGPSRERLQPGMCRITRLLNKQQVRGQARQYPRPECGIARPALPYVVGD